MSKIAKFFGTDGIRGRAGEGKLSKTSIAHLGLALGKYMAETSPGGTVLIGKDTRDSGEWILDLLSEGLTAFGIQVDFLGVLPTAAASYLTQIEPANLGIMITASHNPVHDNGLKLFGADGSKLSDDVQSAIETIINETDISVPKVKKGRVRARLDLKERYIETALSSLGDGISFENLSVVLDCANGAGYETAPAILRRLGVKALTVIGDQPDGRNINLNCGSTSPEKLCQKVVEEGADIGIALDGDADRLIMCDENGTVLNGDQLMGALTLHWKREDRLSKPALVATVMSNLGLERLMEKSGLSLIRTAVGDRHVAAQMKQGGYNLGGEQSGHMLMPDYLPTGDGMMAAIQVLSVVVSQNKAASAALNVFDPMPQKLTNVRYSGEPPVGHPDLVKAVQKIEADFGKSGRVLIRASGTEPLIRIMVEGESLDTVEEKSLYLEQVVKAIN